MKLGIVMDPIAGINIKKDSSFALLLAAQRRGWGLYYMELTDLFARDGDVLASMRGLNVMDDPANWFQFSDTYEASLSTLDVILIRKDPPFDLQYLLATFLLEQAEHAGVSVINRPASLRDCNEKIFTLQFPQCIPPTLVSSDAAQLRRFLAEHHDIIIKPPDGMGGASIFRLQEQDPNISVILETVTQRGTRYAIAQRYLAEIKAGDKRILMIGGEPVAYALARIPAAGETRGNLAAGGRGEGVELTTRDHWLCEQVGPALRERGLHFVGLDVIGDYLTEINVTSPTCIRELDAIYNLDIAGDLLTHIELLRNPARISV